MHRTFSAPDVCRLTGATYRKLDYWCRIGVLEPPMAANGSGTQRGFDEHELRICALVNALSELGVPMRVCARVAAYLRLVPLDASVWDEALFVSADGDVQTVRRLFGFGPPEPGWVVLPARVRELEPA